MRMAPVRSIGWVGHSASRSSIESQNRMEPSVTPSSNSKAVGFSSRLQRKTTRVRSITARRASRPADGPWSLGSSTVSVSGSMTWTPISCRRRARERRSSRSVRTTRTAECTERKTSKATAGCSSKSTRPSRAAGLEELHDRLVTPLARVIERRGSVVAGRLRVRPCVEQHLHDGQISVRGRFVERGVIRLTPDVRIAMGGNQCLHKIGMHSGYCRVESGIRESARSLHIHVRALFPEDLGRTEMSDERPQSDGRETYPVRGVHPRTGLPQDRLEPPGVPDCRRLLKAQCVLPGLRQE